MTVAVMFNCDPSSISHHFRFSAEKWKTGKLQFEPSTRGIPSNFVVKLILLKMRHFAIFCETA